VQVPLVQWSFLVQALPSLQVVVSGLFVAAEQLPVEGSQVPAVWH